MRLNTLKITLSFRSTFSLPPQFTGSFASPPFQGIPNKWALYLSIHPKFETIGPNPGQVKLAQREIREARWLPFFFLRMYKMANLICPNLKSIGIWTYSPVIKLTNYSLLWGKQPCDSSPSIKRNDFLSISKFTSSFIVMKPTFY